MKEASRDACRIRRSDRIGLGWDRMRCVCAYDYYCLLGLERKNENTGKAISCPSPFSLLFGVGVCFASNGMGGEGGEGEGTAKAEVEKRKDEEEGVDCGRYRALGSGAH